MTWKSKYARILQAFLFSTEAACENPNRHSEQSEESHGFIFNQKIKR
jgi:hypothetical protein